MQDQNQTPPPTITPEMIEQMVNMQREKNDPAMQVIAALHGLRKENGLIPNVSETENFLARCIVLNKDGALNDTIILNGESLQNFNPTDGDYIIWATIGQNFKALWKQTGLEKSDIVMLQPNELEEQVKHKAGYAINYLSSFNSDNNILLDDQKVEAFYRVENLLEDLLKNSHAGIRTLLTAKLVNHPEPEKIIPSWNDATVYNPADTENPFTIEWGITAKTDDEEYIEFIDKQVIYWIKPQVENQDGEQVPDNLLQVITRGLKVDNVPACGPNTIVNFSIKEQLPEHIRAVMFVNIDVTKGDVVSIELFKTEDFDVSKASF